MLIVICNGCGTERFWDYERQCWVTCQVCGAPRPLAERDGNPLPPNWELLDVRHEDMEKM